MENYNLESRMKQKFLNLAYQADTVPVSMYDLRTVERDK
jgi:hypothetical protein